MTDTIEAIAAIVTGIIGLAIVAVIVSRRAATSQVVQSAGSALSGVIGAAVSPITGGGGNYGFGSPFTSSGQSPLGYYVL